MKTLLWIGLSALIAASAGCVVEDEPRHGRAAVVDSDHHHGPGCGHVYVKGVWYDER